MQANDYRSTAVPAFLTFAFFPFLPCGGHPNPSHYLLLPTHYLLSGITSERAGDTSYPSEWPVAVIC